MWLGSLANAILVMWSGFLENICALVSMDPAAWQTGGDISPFELAQKIHSDSTLMTVAAGLVVVFWAISFFRYVDSLHQIDLREVLGWILRLALVYATLEMSFDIMRSVMQIGLQINDGILGVTGEAGGFAIELPEGLRAGMDAAQAALDTGSIFEKIGAFFSQLLPSLMLLVVFIVVFACGMVIVLTLFMRFFRLYIYIAIAPIPLATLAGSATQEIGTHFLKSWLAVCLEICIISIAIGIFNASLASGQGLLPAFEAAADEVPAADALFYPTMKWAAGFLVKVVLLTSVVKGSDQFTSRLVGV